MTMKRTDKENVAYMCIMEFYLAIKINKIMLFTEKIYELKIVISQINNLVFSHRKKIYIICV